MNASHFDVHINLRISVCFNLKRCSSSDAFSFR